MHRSHSKSVSVAQALLCFLGFASTALGQSKSSRVFTNDDLSVNSPVQASDEPLPAGDSKGAPYVPTPMLVLDRMLEIANVNATDVVYDLGSGDGRIVLRAAQRFGAQSVGIEIERTLVQESKDKAQEMKLEGLAKFYQGDVFVADLSPATVVTIYLLPEMLKDLRPHLEKKLRPGTRVVVHDMPIPIWKPSREDSVQVAGRAHAIYFYTIPEAFRKPQPQQ